MARKQDGLIPLLKSSLMWTVRLKPSTPRPTGWGVGRPFKSFF